MKKIEVIEIHSGVPIPDSYTRYPFDSLAIGDVFYVGVEKRPSVASLVTRLNKSGSRQYEVHKVDAERIGVWRVEDKKEEK